MIPRSLNGPLTRGVAMGAPGFQSGAPKAPPVEAKAYPDDIDPQLIHPVNLYPTWPTRDDLKDLNLTFMFSAHNHHIMRLTEGRKRRREWEDRGDKDGSFKDLHGEVPGYHSSTTGVTYKKGAVQAQEYTLAGALPHINFLLAKAQKYWAKPRADAVELKIPLEAHEILSDVFPMFPLGVHNTKEREVLLGAGLPNRDGRIAEGHMGIVVNNIVSGKQDTHNIWDPSICLRQPVGFELAPVPFPQSQAKYRLHYDGLVTVDLPDRDYPVLWQVVPVCGDELAEGLNLREMKFGDEEVLFHTRKWTVGSVCSEVRFGRRGGRAVDPKVLWDIREHLAQPTIGVRLNCAPCGASGQPPQLDRPIP